MNEFFPLFGFVFFCLIIVLFFIKKWLGDIAKNNKTSDDLIAWLQTVTTTLESSNQNIDKKLSENMRHFNDRLDKAAYVIAEVQKNIGEFSEIGRGMKEIQEFLQSPKLRGNIGEQILKDLLQQFFPKQSFVLQYTFKSGEKVDAAIKTSYGLIAIDSKFPMENFKKFMSTAASKEEIMRSKKDFVRDVRKHITDIARKYIVPEEQTVDYALMYIPSESVYYQIITDQELYNCAAECRVLIVSPMSFYAYMKAILMSFEGQKIQERTREMIHLIQSLKKDYQKTDDALSVLNRHITNAYNQSVNVSRSFMSFGQKLDTTRLVEGEDKNQSQSMRVT